MVALAGCTQADASPAHPEGPVVDTADILPPETEASLDKKLRDYFDKNHTALIVASVDSLGGQPIEKVSLRMAEDWGIGDARTLRGLLVLVAPNEHQVRIEVSCGLESVITDVAAGRVIREDMIPLFKQGDIAQATVSGVDALIGRLDAGPNPAPAPDSCKAMMKEAA